MTSAARTVGIAPRTLHRRAAEDPALRLVIDQARARLREAVASAVARRALAGSLPAARLTMTRWRDQRGMLDDLLNQQSGKSVDALQVAFIKRERAAGRGS